MESGKTLKTTALSNQEYRSLLVKNAFEIMKVNQYKYSRQSHLYTPQQKKSVKNK